MKTENDIKKLLQQERSVSLSSQEKLDMKNVLLSHATESLSHAVPQRRGFFMWGSWQKYVTVSFASLLLIFTGTTYASTESLPGEPLYAVKVHVAEELVGLSKFTDAQKLSYDIELMKTRLHELKELAQSDSLLEADDLELIHEQIDDHIASALSDVAASEDDAPEETIDKLSDLNSLTQAQEKVIKSNTKFNLISNDITDARRTIDTTLDLEVDDFVTESTPEEVNDYLGDQLDDVAEHIEQLTSDDKNTEQIQKLLSDANESLIEGDIREALTTVIKAQDSIDSEEYITGGEDESVEINEMDIINTDNSTSSNQ